MGKEGRKKKLIQTWMSLETMPIVVGLPADVKKRVKQKLEAAYK